MVRENCLICLKGLNTGSSTSQECIKCGKWSHIKCLNEESTDSERKNSESGQSYECSSCREVSRPNVDRTHVEDTTRVNTEEDQDSDSESLDCASVLSWPSISTTAMDSEIVPSYVQNIFNRMEEMENQIKCLRSQVEVLQGKQGKQNEGEGIKNTLEDESQDDIQVIEEKRTEAKPVEPQPKPLPMKTSVSDQNQQSQQLLC